MQAKEEFIVRIVDDDPEVLESLRDLLETEDFKVETYAGAREFLTGDSPSVPGCAVIDIRMPEMSGIELHEVLISRKYRNPIIFLTGHGDVDIAVTALRRGAMNFLQKPVKPEKFLEAVLEAQEKVNRLLTYSPEEANRLWDRLTPREREVAKLSALGKSNREIGVKLGCNERTVEAHRYSINKKLGIAKVSELEEFCTLIREK